MELANLSAQDAARHIREGDISAEEYAAALLRRHEQLAHLNTLITLRPANVLEQARIVDRARQNGALLGPLAGVPFVAKDQIEVAGYPTTLGTPALRNYISPRNAAVIDLLASAGAVFFGKANLHELAAGGTSSNPTFGSVRNPYDLSRIPGGSSGGTAAALAAHIVPLGLGEDTGGSIRIPAGFCGVCGLRPSTWPRKRYSDAGLVPPPAPDDTQTIGPMARTVSDLALLDAVITGSGPLAAPDVNGLRIGIPHDDFWEDEAIDAGVAEAVRGAFERLRSAGAVLVPIDLREVAATGDRLVSIVEIGDPQRFANWLEQNVPGVTWRKLIDQVASADVKAYFSSPRRIDSSLSPTERSTRRERSVREYVELLRVADVCAVAFPDPLIPAPLIHEGGDPVAREVEVNGRRMSFHSIAIRYTVFSSRLGVPGLVLPAGLAAGLPVGLELDGLPGGDRQLLAVGMAIEAALGPLPPPGSGGFAAELSSSGHPKASER